ncbi:MAG: UDP-N-acetylmuramoyl-tripeptide--D-alanyl-D-alanine ligase [Ignavibacteria bacterium]|nr:UDP-N-acetylmuramoyl-tripeptide--D-alanyl-D-alanine ligase [Ignavibacteria bacterium]
MIKLKDILRLKKCECKNLDKLNFNSFPGISIDSRKIKKNQLFLAIKGENHDSHDYIRDVFRKGVSAVFVNKKWYIKNKDKVKSFPLFVVDDTIKALGELAKIHRENFNIPVICIGGSNGKTTTKDILGWVLRQKYNVLVTEGNYNNHIGLPLTLLSLNSRHQICLLEVGTNHFNEISYLCDIAQPDYGLITNIGREHLEFFKNLQGVAKEEFKLFDYVLENKKDGICFANFDDKFIRNYFRRINKERYFSYSYMCETDLKGKFIDYDKNFYPLIELTYMNKTVRFKINTFGKHSIFNAIAAASVAVFFKMSLNQIKRAFETYNPPRNMRMEIIKCNGVMFINDAYNSNPDSLKLGLESLKEYNTTGKKHIVLSDMLEMGKASRDEHTRMGKLIQKMNFENLYTIGKDAIYFSKGASKLKNNFYFKNIDEMAEFLKKVVKQGDVVYLKASRGMKLENLLNKIIN